MGKKRFKPFRKITTEIQNTKDLEYRLWESRKNITRYLLYSFKHTVKKNSGIYRYNLVDWMKVFLLYLVTFLFYYNYKICWGNLIWIPFLSFLEALLILSYMLSLKFMASLLH